MGNIVNGFDISDSSVLLSRDRYKNDYEYAIIKSSSGTTVADKMYKDFADNVTEAGNRMAFYHAANGKTSGEKEAKFFLSSISQYIGNALVILDFRNTSAQKKGVEYAKEFADYIFMNAGLNTIICMDKDCLSNNDWSEYSKSYPYLWIVDDLFDDKIVIGYQKINRYKIDDLKGFTLAFLQYTTRGRFEKDKKQDINFNFDKCYLTTKQWKELIIPAEVDKEEAIVEEEKKVEEKPIIVKEEKVKQTSPIVNTSSSYYTINKGESLSKVAELYNTTINNIMKLNPSIKNPSLIRPGQRIKIK